MSWDEAVLRYDVFIDSFTYIMLTLMTFDMWISYTTKAIPSKKKGR